ncbi:hypothetical protein F4810DRAFT_652038 [Camillea tinctor]|nr:hypothetical protein F4810DRAFT_652038 [Camillea tinctor]
MMALCPVPLCSVVLCCVVSSSPPCDARRTTVVRLTNVTFYFNFTYSSCFNIHPIDTHSYHFFSTVPCEKDERMFLPSVECQSHPISQSVYYPCYGRTKAVRHPHYILPCPHIPIPIHTCMSCILEEHKSLSRGLTYKGIRLATYRNNNTHCHVGGSLYVH